jgi:hypothetical protein
MVMVRPSTKAEEGQYRQDHDHEADQIDNAVHFLVVSLTFTVMEKVGSRSLVAPDR